MRLATNTLSVDEVFSGETDSRFDLEPLREVLGSDLFTELLRAIWEPASCFAPPPSDLDIALNSSHTKSLPEVVSEVRDKIVQHAVNSRHVWTLAHMTPPSATISVLADFIVGALNQCAFIWEEGPLARALEAETVSWLARRLGLPMGTRGLLTSGGTLSNCLAAYLALTKEREAPGEPQGSPVVIASDQAHLSIRKAAAFVGAGRDAVLYVPTDGEGRLQPGQVAATAARAVVEGMRPFLFVCTAGTSNAGTLEPADEFLEAARRHGAWCHIDASHGGLVTLASQPHPAASRWAEADSISWDPHKSLYVSFAVGSLLLRQETLLKPLEFHSEYALKEDGRQHDAGAWHLEGSRRLEALKLWMVISHLGDAGLVELTDRSLALARELAMLVRAADDFRLVTPPDTNVVCFRYEDRTLAAATLDQVNVSVQKHLYRAGGPLVSSTRIGGRATLRAVLTHPLLDGTNLREILEAIRCEARRQVATLPR